VGFFSKEIAMTEAKSEILNWLEKEVKTSSGTKLAQLSRALKEISAVDYSQLDLF